MHISKSIFIFWGPIGIPLHDLQFKNYLSFKTGCFSSCSDWLVPRSCPSADFHQVQRLHKQTIVAIFHLFFPAIYSKSNLVHTYLSQNMQVDNTNTCGTTLVTKTTERTAICGKCANNLTSV